MDILNKYLLVFCQGALPWLEVLGAVPVGTAMGLPVLSVCAVAFAGNAVAIYLTIAGFHWWERARGPLRWRWSPRAMRVWERYGLPGTALLGPLVLGTHLSVLMALALGAKRGLTAWWMLVGLIVWTAIAGTVTVAGLAILGW